MGKKYDVVVTEKYTDKNGEEKNSFTNIGVVLEKDGKFYLKLKMIPVGWDGFASLYVPKPRDGQQGGGQRRQPAQQPTQAPVRQGNFDDFDDDIPF